ncbi:MAG: hypothetical protein ACK4F7_04115 [Inhella sp.]
MPSPLISIVDLQALLASLGALRHGRALALLLATLCCSGLFMASVEPALAGERWLAASVWALAALLSLFYGVNATGWLLMREALGGDERLEPFDALLASLRQAHRVLAVLLLALAPWLPLLALLLAGLWAARLPGVGLPLLTLLAPLTVLASAWLALVLFVLVGPLAGPAIWAGASVGEAARWLRAQARRRLIEATLLKLALLGLVGGVGAVLSLALLSGARLMALAAWATSLPVPPQQVIAHLFGHTLKALGQRGAPVVANDAALGLSIGGGMLVALVVVLPTLVYLRGCCAIYLSLRRRDDQ